MTYLDTSALLKRFVTEPGTVLVTALVSRHGPVATATIAFAELHAGLARKRREGYLSEGEYTLTCRRFEHDWGAYVRVGLDDDVLMLARDLVRRHPLEGFDAIHLASALALRTALAEDFAFAAADSRLLEAARAERFRALNVERSHVP
ncbi:MAG: type II toxin-antitoxin system VapC family toxin [candidate division NC10 bacterium]|nr:type II toxin-antitoxin system VapC family toxin [candidate division NC10 bacterium]